ncbi:MAG: aminotransferase class I/II-fold pyridoxal phosphate-dependent enzyme, partial [Methylocystaceae bacterium]
MEGIEPGFYSALKEYAESGSVQLHMPGHKGGRGFKTPELAAIGSIDFTEIPGLDDWHRPDGVLLKAQQKLADIYGAASSYFLVNGATSGVHALLLALGDKARVLLPRQAHRSFFGGMVLAGTIPVYLPTRLDNRWGLPLASDPDDVEDLLQGQEITALFGSSPSYFGICGQEKEMIDLVHRRGIPALVDQAHGAHFGFHPAYPPGALQQGADAVVHGLHKTLPALTGAACVHLSGKMMSRHTRVVQALNLLITTSPSQPLLASAEWASSWVRSSAGWAGLDAMYTQSQQFDQQLEKVTGLERIKGDEHRHHYDPGRVSIGIEKLNLTGYGLQELLFKEYGIQLEMAGPNYIVALFTPFNTAREWETFSFALSVIADHYRGNHRAPVQLVLPPEAPLILAPRQAYFSRQRQVRISEAAGLISAEMVAAYPPGVPCLLPGEAITRE